MRRFLKGFHKRQKGFTLVELLIVVAILGILAAVAIPNLVSFIGTGDTEARATELDVVQTAMIAVMADNNVSTVDAQPTAVGPDLSAYPTGTGIDPARDFSLFLMDPTNVAYTYTWTAGGVVSQAP